MISGSHASVAETEASHELMLEVVVSRSEQGSLKSAGASIDGGVLSTREIIAVVVETFPHSSVAVKVTV